MKCSYCKKKKAIFTNHTYTHGGNEHMFHFCKSCIAAIVNYALDITCEGPQIEMMLARMGKVRKAKLYIDKHCKKIK